MNSNAEFALVRTMSQVLAMTAVLATKLLASPLSNDEAKPAAAERNPAVIVESVSPADSNDAASNYLFAALDLGIRVPDYVDSATTDDPNNGFSVLLSDQQKSYLKLRSSTSALSRFDAATSCHECVWSRYSGASWSDAHLNDCLHRLARVASLRARLHYEAGQWIEGNRCVERVRIMARHMALQARPYEHQCFMVENIGMGTAAAYVLQFPKEALTDFHERHQRLGPFSPKASMLAAEAKRLKALAESIEAESVTTNKSLDFIYPYFANEEDEQRFSAMPSKNAADQLRGLASFLSDLAALIEGDHNGVEKRFTELYHQHSSMCPLVAGLSDPISDYREHAQGMCRAAMVGAVIEQLLSDRPDFATIKDPYGTRSFEFRKQSNGFILVSELKNHSRIDFTFGLAASR